MPNIFDFYVQGSPRGTVIGLQVHDGDDTTDVPMSVATARAIGLILLSHVNAVDREHC